MDSFLLKVEQRLDPVWKRVENTRGGRFARDIVRALLGLLHGVRGEQVSVRAAALTYISLFSLVPLLRSARGLSSGNSWSE